MAPSAGVVDATVGGGFGATVNDHTLSAAIGAPATSVTPVVILAVYVTPAAKFAFGFRVATVLPEIMVTVAGTGVPLLVCTSVKVEVVTVDGFIASLNVATTLAEAATFVAPSAGVVDATVGGGFGARNTTNPDFIYAGPVILGITINSHPYVSSVGVCNVIALKTIRTCAISREYSGIGIGSPSSRGRNNKVIAAFVSLVPCDL